MNQKPTDDSGAPDASDKVSQDRQILKDAQARGPGATLGAWVRLSGPGWLQSAITLGGGSLAGALFLGSLGGVSMLWLQLMAIVMGVIMLSAISFVTLSTGERPFQAINQHINPALGWGWLIATCMANMIWCMPQFSLCYDALDKNLLRDVGGLEPAAVTAPLAIAGGSTDSGSTAAPAAAARPAWLTKLVVSLILLGAAGVMVALNARRGLASRFFDILLKALVAMVVLSFFGVVLSLTFKGELNWLEILAGFIPDFRQWWEPTGKLADLLVDLPEDARDFWSKMLVKNQSEVMIAAAATAVGINMTFLMPYSMLHRGWDKTFRGLARFDLSTGMAIPYVLVTSCVVIAAAHVFNATADPAFLSDDPVVMATSPIYASAQGNLVKRVGGFSEGYDQLSPAEQKAEQQQLAAKIAALPAAEKKVAASLVQRNAFQLSQAIGPIVGNDKLANYMFGLGVFGMCFSTIIVLMLINGFAFCEMFNRPDSSGLYALGCLVAGVSGSLWFWVWDGPSKPWLVIVTSSFGAMLLPIAYLTFFMMMNSKSLMGAEKPTGWRMVVWNLLMAFAVLGAFAAASQTIYSKLDKPLEAPIVLSILGVFVVAVIAGFAYKAFARPAERASL
ncbi:divalent metal cation transporter [Lignipirellula cremea]|uniref:Natural resistance-associated macrophage protein n=1 Tax=Lignipirellula cremea TaxID=2528010 RepID=A0A518E2Q9_9BACT|nr:divalent metal cation transporter [Lignipirellula cremea]QDU98379.1 Natural resistance-associated macrophage protein [Lignipirellula cremea]